MIDQFVTIPFCFVFDSKKSFVSFLAYNKSHVDRVVLAVHRTVGVWSGFSLSPTLDFLLQDLPYNLSLAKCNESKSVLLRGHLHTDRLADLFNLLQTCGSSSTEIAKGLKELLFEFHWLWHHSSEPDRDAKIVDVLVKIQNFFE